MLMGKITLKRSRARLSVPSRVIKRAVQEVLKMPDSEFDFENPEIVIVTKRVPRKKDTGQKVKAKQAVAKKPKLKNR